MDLVNEPGTLAELRAARAWGVSWSRWCGTRPTTTTTYEYEDGRVVRTVTVADPDWTDLDRRAALALAQYEQDLCGGCGQPMSETTKADNDGRYVPMAAVRCHFCTAAEIGRTAYQDNSQASALHVPVRLLPLDPEHQEVAGGADERE